MILYIYFFIESYIQKKCFSSLLPLGISTLLQGHNLKGKLVQMNLTSLLTILTKVFVLTYIGRAPVYLYDSTPSLQHSWYSTEKGQTPKRAWSGRLSSHGMVCIKNYINMGNQTFKRMDGKPVIMTKLLKNNWWSLSLSVCFNCRERSILLYLDRNSNTKSLNLLI